MVWVGPEARWAQADEVWPPQFAIRRGQSTNRVKLLLIVTLITVLMVGLTTLLFLSLSVSSRSEARSPTLILAVVLILLIGLPVSILVLWEWLKARIMAPTPSACWTHVGKVVE